MKAESESFVPAFKEYVAMRDGIAARYKKMRDLLAGEPAEEFAARNEALAPGLTAAMTAMAEILPLPLHAPAVATAAADPYEPLPATSPSPLLSPPPSPPLSPRW